MGTLKTDRRCDDGAAGDESHIKRGDERCKAMADVDG